MMSVWTPCAIRTIKEGKKMDIYRQIMEIIAEERKKRGKPAIMKGSVIGRLIRAIDAMLDYEPKNATTK